MAEMGQAIWRTETSIPVFQAMQHIVPVRPDYCLAPIAEGFNWSDCLSFAAEGEWYLVVFRSVRRESADVLLLTVLDDRAFEEARAASGLLYYFKGELNERRECLSFCLWEDQPQAWSAAGLQHHIAAAALVRDMYQSYRLERYRVLKQAGSPVPQFLPIHGGPIPALTEQALPAPSR